MTLTESHIEDATLEWLAELGYAIGHGPHLAPGEPAAERTSFGDVFLSQRLRDAIARLNSAIPDEAREALLPKLLRGELRVAGVESTLAGMVAQSTTAQTRKPVR